MNQLLDIAAEEFWTWASHVEATATGEEEEFLNVPKCDARLVDLPDARGQPTLSSTSRAPIRILARPQGGGRPAGNLPVSVP